MPETNNLIGMEELSQYDAFIKYYIDENAGQGGSGGGSSSIIIDSSLSSSSENPVQNKVIKTALDDKVSKSNTTGLLKNDGTVDTTTYLSSVPIASTSTPGLVKVDGNTISINNGVISASSSGSVTAVTGINDNNIYSSTEKIVGCSINGKPIYQKSVFISNLLSYGTTDILYTHNISNIDEVLDYKGIVNQNKKNDGSLIATMVLPFCGLNGAGTSYMPNYSFEINKVTSTQIDIRIGSGLTTTTDRTISILVTVQYTKTTDTENSFNFSSENDYSLTEKVVGTWINGKPLYQRTFDIGTLPNSNTKYVSTGISNIGKILKITGMTMKNNIAIPLPYTDTSGSTQYQISLAFVYSESSYTNAIRITCASDRSSFTESYVTIKYTKTTD